MEFTWSDFWMIASIGFLVCFLCLWVVGYAIAKFYEQKEKYAAKWFAMATIFSKQILNKGDEDGEEQQDQ